MKFITAALLCLASASMLVRAESEQTILLANETDVSDPDVNEDFDPDEVSFSDCLLV